MNRRRLFQVEATAHLMLDILQSYRAEGRFALHAFVIMPDHLHVLLTPSPEVSLEKAVQYIKGGFSFRFKSKTGVWERSFNQTQVLDLEKFDACERYIEQNPVKAGVVESGPNYLFSSAHPAAIVDPMPEHFLRRTRG